MRSRAAKVKGERGGTGLSRDRALAFAAALVCAALALALGARSLDVPGLYYDEVIQAEPALWFVRGEAEPPEVPGALSVPLFGRPFPVMTQPYMGALKSQLLIPLFAVRAPSAEALRLATLAVAVAGLVCALLFVARIYGAGSAWLFGLLLAVDPSFLFIGRHDWGSFSLGLLLRSAAALALWSGWTARSSARLFLGGLCAGLAVYNKIDAAAALAAAAAALACVLPEPLRALRERSAGLALAAAGALLGAAPLVWRALPALAMTRRAVDASASASGEWSEKWSALAAVLDGSYFARLILAGGSFERMAGVEGAPATALTGLFLLCCSGLGLWLLQERRNGRRHPAHAFALLAALFTLAALLATPRAIRVHHFMNAWPLPQLVVAVTLAGAWRLAGPRRVARGAVALLLAGRGGGRAAHGSEDADAAARHRRQGPVVRRAGAARTAARRRARGVSRLGLRGSAAGDGSAPARGRADLDAARAAAGRDRGRRQPDLPAARAALRGVPVRRRAAGGAGRAAAGQRHAHAARRPQRRDRLPLAALRASPPARLPCPALRGGAAMSAIQIVAIDHVVLRVADVERALRFYCGALGCTEERRIESLGLYQLRAGASLIDLVAVDGPLGKLGGPPPGVGARNMDHVALQLAAFDEAALRAHLVRCGVEPGDVGQRYGAQGNGPSMYIRDPDGNVVELKGPPDPAAGQ